MADAAKDVAKTGKKIGASILKWAPKIMMAFGIVALVGAGAATPAGAGAGLLGATKAGITEYFNTVVEKAPHALEALKTTAHNIAPSVFGGP